MPGTEGQPAGAGKGAALPRASLRNAALACAAVLAARLIYLWLLSPYELSEDEAFYWEWSLHMDWSYATKGPGIAWAIWLATHLLGTSVASVRTVAAVSGAVGAFFVGGLAADMSFDRHGDATRAARAGVVGAVLFTLAPVFQVTSLLATIDGPFLACWALGAWAAWRALRQGSGRAWAVLGLALGLGFLFKYTVLMLVPGVAVFAWLEGRRGGRGLRAGSQWARWVTLGVALTVAGLAPVVIWNAQHDWQTVRHLMGHLGMAGGDRAQASGGARQAYSPMWTIGLVGSQAGFLGAAVVACAVVIWRAGRPGSRVGEPAFAFGWWVGAPVLLMYLVLSFVAKPEGNWPIAGWVTVLAAGAVWLGESANGKRQTANGGQQTVDLQPIADSRLPIAPSDNGLRRSVWRWSVWSGVVVALGLARLDLVRQGAGLISPALARGVPVGRVMGISAVAESALEQQRLLRVRTGLEPFIVAQQYGRASLLRFVLPGRPVVYCASSQTGNRIVQQDYWADTDLASPSLLGRPALLIGGDQAGKAWATAFDTVEPIGPLPGEVKVGDKGGRPSFIGIGYTGRWPKPNPVAGKEGRP